MSYQELLNQVEGYVITLFKRHPNEKLTYHNFDHTRKVAQHAQEIGIFYQLDEESLFIIAAAAWFHDTGYLFTGANDHEPTGVAIMKDFFSDKDVPAIVTDKIERCILATSKFTHPSFLLEQILCDADTYHFGTSEFRHTDSLVQKEVELQTGSKPGEWNGRAINMLKHHKFYTKYCKDRLNDGKAQNILWLQSKSNQ